MINLLIRGKMNSLFKIDNDAMIQDNYGDGSNPTIPVTAPRGVLAGSVAAIKGSYLAGAADGKTTEIGIFANDAAGAPFENTPTVASGKITVVQGMASLEVDVYANVTFKVGDKLYADKKGLLTNVKSTTGTVIGICTKAPTTSAPTLGLDMLI
jgi:hypothetical protein